MCKNPLCSSKNVILTELWLEEISRVATLSVHNMELLQLDKHGSCTQKFATHFLLRFCIPTSLGNVCLLVLFYRNTSYCSCLNILAAIYRGGYRISGKGGRARKFLDMPTK